MYHLYIHDILCKNQPDKPKDINNHSVRIREGRVERERENRGGGGERSKGRARAQHSSPV